MDPERLKKVIAKIKELRGQGVSDRTISSFLRRADNVPFNSINTVLKAGQAAGFVGPSGELLPEGTSAIQKAKEALTPVIQGSTGSLASDALSGLEKLHLAAPGAARRFRGDLYEARRKHPILSAAGQLAGLIAGPGGLGARGTKLAAEGLGALGGNLGEAAVRGLGGAKLAENVAAPLGRGLGIIAGGATAGGLEGGLFGFGEAAGKPVAERVRESGPSALLGAGLGAAFEAVPRGVLGLRRVLKAPEGKGGRLVKAIEENGPPLNPASHDALLNANKSAADVAGQASRALGKDIPGEATDLLMSGDLDISRALSRVDTEESRKFIAWLKKARAAEKAGEPVPPAPAASASMVQDVIQKLKDEAATFKKVRGADAVKGRVTATRAGELDTKAQALTDLLDQASPDFEIARRMTRLTQPQIRAAALGESVANDARVAERLAKGEKVRIGKKMVGLDNAPGTGMAFRIGILKKVVRSLEGETTVPDFIKSVEAGGEKARLMKVALGGEERYQQFLKAVQKEGSNIRKAELAKVALKIGGFSLGTSLIGLEASHLLGSF